MVRFSPVLAVIYPELESNQMFNIFLATRTNSIRHVKVRSDIRYPWAYFYSLHTDILLIVHCHHRAFILHSFCIQQALN